MRKKKSNVSVFKDATKVKEIDGTVTRMLRREALLLYLSLIHI